MNKKFGFTLAEVLITLAIAGVIASLSIQVVKSQKDNFAFACYYFFRDLKITVGHMGASTVGGGLSSYSCERAEDVSEAAYQACMASKTTPSGGGGGGGEGGEGGEGEGGEGTTDPYILDYETGAGFCEGLAKYLGTASAIKCSAGDLNDATLTDVYGSIESGQDENFRLMNGYIVYVSDRVVPVASSSGAGEDKKNIPYRIITVDINGGSSPNEVGKDIISFAVFDNGEVLPLGEPATSTKHFIAVIKMRNIAERESTTTAKKNAIRGAQHPATILKTANGKSLSFKDAYCRVLGVATIDTTYCDGQTISGEFFEYDDLGTLVDVPVTYCYDTKYNADGSPAKQVNGKNFVAECEFNVIKPQVSALIPISQDIYSSKDTRDATASDEYADEEYQIYQY